MQVHTKNMRAMPLSQSHTVRALRGHRAETESVKVLKIKITARMREERKVIGKMGSTESTGKHGGEQIASAQT